jgi:hypothetical protein
MRQYKSKAKNWRDLQTLIKEYWVNDKEELMKGETLATVYLLDKIGYDETGAPEHIIEAAHAAMHDIIGIYVGLVVGEEKK